MQYATQLSETARRPWSTIVGEQINCEPWVDVYGKEHPEKRLASWTSFVGASSCTCSLSFGQMQQSKNGSTSTMG